MIKNYYRLAKPGIVYGNALVAAAGFIDLQENILGQVLGFRLIAQGAENKVHHGLFVFINQPGKSSAVATLYTKH